MDKLYRVTILVDHEKENPVIAVNDRDSLDSLLDILFETRYEVSVFKC